MKIKYRVISLLLAVALLFGGIPAAFAANSDTQKPFQIHVYSAEGEKFQGEFLVKNKKLYVDADTVLKMHKDIEFVSVPKGVTAEMCLARGEKTVTYRITEVLDENERAYLPFEKTMFDLDLWIEMPVAGTLVVKNPPELSGLLQAIYDIVLVKKYNMPHWWGTDQALKDFNSAYRADAVLGELFGYLSGNETRDQFETACFNIMHPMSDEELEFALQTIDMIELNDDVKDIVDSLEKTTDKIDKEGLQKFADTYGLLPEKMELDFMDLLQTESLMKMFAYTCGVKGEEAEYIRGLTYVLNTQKNDDEKLFEGGYMAIAMKEGEFSVWEAWASKIVLGGAAWAMDTLTDYALPVDEILKTAELVGDKAFGTKNVVDGTIMAYRYLTIQDMCAKSILTLRRNYLKDRKFDDVATNKAVMLQRMVDVAKVYMKAGVLAWDARATDTVSREAAQDQLMSMVEDLELLDQYTPEMIGYTLNYKTVTQQIIACAKTALKDFAVYELPPETVVSDEVVVEVTWDCMSAGQYRFVDVWVYGTADNGEWVERAETEGEYVAGGKGIASQEVYDGYTKVTFRGVDGEYRMEIGNFDDWMRNNWSIHDYNLKVTVSAPGQKPVVITDEPEKYLLAGMDGFWYYCFGFEDWKVTPQMIIND